MNDYSEACFAAFESGQERKKVEEEAPWAGPWAEPRELTTSAFDEREARENKQWRRHLQVSTIGWGSGGSKASSSGGGRAFRP